MAIHIPRKYLTFSELIERWKCEENDIRDAIISGSLVPSIFVHGKLQWAEFVPTTDFLARRGALEAKGRFNVDGDPFMLTIDSWLDLRNPVEVGVMACVFPVLCSSATAAPEVGLTVADWYIPSRPIEIQQVVDEGVFMMSEVVRFESEAVGKSTDRAAGDKARRTLLNIIAVLKELASAKRDKDLSQSELIQEMLANYPEKYGIAKSTLEQKFADANRSLQED